MTRRFPLSDNTELYRANWSPESTAPEIEPGAAYGAIRCVPANEIPDRGRCGVRVPRDFWLSLNREVLLRLEQTPRKEALRIPFANQKLAQRGVRSIYNYTLRNLGDGLIEVYQREAVVYVRRGKNWGKLPSPDLAALTK